MSDMKTDIRGALLALDLTEDGDESKSYWCRNCACILVQHKAEEISGRWYVRCASCSTLVLLPTTFEPK